MRITVLLALLALPAHASLLQALVLTGAKTEADAKPLLERMQSRASASNRFIAFPEGFPKLVKSDSVDGLKPGFFVVLAGFCDTDGMFAVSDALKAIDAGSYSKTVEVEAAACPSLVKGVSVETLIAKDSGKRALRGVFFEDDSEDRGWTMFVSLRDKAGVELDAKVFTIEPPCVEGGRNEFLVKGAELRVVTTGCMMNRGCPNPGEGATLSIISVEDQTIDLKNVITKSPGYEGCHGE